MVQSLSRFHPFHLATPGLGPVRVEVVSPATIVQVVDRAAVAASGTAGNGVPCATGGDTTTRFSRFAHENLPRVHPLYPAGSPCATGCNQQDQYSGHHVSLNCHRLPPRNSLHQITRVNRRINHARAAPGMVRITFDQCNAKMASACAATPAKHPPRHHAGAFPLRASDLPPTSRTASGLYGVLGPITAPLVNLQLGLGLSSCPHRDPLGRVIVDSSAASMSAAAPGSAGTTTWREPRRHRHAQLLGDCLFVRSTKAGA